MKRLILASICTTTLSCVVEPIEVSYSGGPTETCAQKLRKCHTFCALDAADECMEEDDRENLMCREEKYIEAIPMCRKECSAEHEDECKQNKVESGKG